MATGVDRPEDLARRFLDAVARIEQALRQRHGDTVQHARGLGQLVSALEDKNKLVQAYRRDLRSFAELRNAIVHHPYDGGRPIAVPLSSTVVRIEEIAEQLERPVTAERALQGTPPLEPVSRATEIHTLLPTMLAADYSQVVVYDPGHPVVLLTTNTIARWVASSIDSHGEAVLLAATVEEVLRLAEDEEVPVVKPRTPVVDILAKFASPVVPRAVVVTTDGKRTSTPTGIFVTSDLPHLHQLLAL